MTRNALIAKEAQGIEKEFQAGAPCFIRQDFRIGQPGVIVDRQMENPALATFLAAAWRALSGTVSRDAMSDPFDAPQLFDVDMDHFARLFLFIADDLDRLIEGGQAAQPLGLCDAGHRAKEKPGLAGDLPERLTGPAQRFDLGDLI